MNKFSLLVAWRYFIKKKSLNAIHLIMWISIASSVIGVASLFLALSVFNGFEFNINAQLHSAAPDLLALPKQGNLLVVDDEKEHALQSVEGLTAYSKILCLDALMQQGEKRALVQLVGVDNQFQQVTDISSYITKESWNVGTPTHPLLTISYEAANQMLIDPDHMLQPLLLSTIVTGRRVTSNILSKLTSDFAHAYTAHYISSLESEQTPEVYTHIAFVRRLGKVPANAYSSLRFKVQDASMLEDVRNTLTKIMGDVNVSSRYEQNETLYHVVQIEKKMMLLILMFILLIAMVGSIGSMRILFLEKVKHALVLHCLGCDVKKNLSIFWIQGCIVSGLGLVGGFALSLLFAYGQQHFAWVRVTSSYYVDMPYPIAVRLEDILTILVVILLLMMIGVSLSLRGIKSRLSNPNLSMLSR